MDIFSQKKFMIWTIALLVLLNIISMMALWYQRGGQPPQARRQADQRQESVTQFLNRELQLTEEQKKEFERLRREHFEASTRLNQEMREAKRELFDRVGAPAPDKTAIEKLAGEIGAKQSQLELLLFNHFTALQNKCTSEQQEKFRSILHDILNLMRPQNQSGERPPRPGDDGQDVRQQRPDQQRPPREQDDQRKPLRQGRGDDGRQRPPRDQ
jgi:Spy/CpxP family protein refolding chaperone